MHAAYLVHKTIENFCDIFPNVWICTTTSHESYCQITLWQNFKSISNAFLEKLSALCQRGIFGGQVFFQLVTNVEDEE